MSPTAISARNNPARTSRHTTHAIVAWLSSRQISKNTISPDPLESPYRTGTPPVRRTRCVRRSASCAVLPIRSCSAPGLSHAAASSEKYMRVFSRMLMPRATIQKFTCGTITRPLRPSTGPGLMVSKVYTPLPRPEQRRPSRGSLCRFPCLAGRPFGEAAAPSGQEMAAINVRYLEGVDLSALKVRHFNGREL
jgi:hypothetical protein